MRKDFDLSTVCTNGKIIGLQRRFLLSDFIIFIRLCEDVTWKDLSSTGELSAVAWEKKDKRYFNPSNLMWHECFYLSSLLHGQSQSFVITTWFYFILFFIFRSCTCWNYAPLLLKMLLAAWECKALSLLWPCSVLALTRTWDDWGYWSFNPDFFQVEVMPSHCHTLCALPCVRCFIMQ